MSRAKLLPPTRIERGAHRRALRELLERHALARAQAAAALVDAQLVDVALAVAHVDGAAAHARRPGRPPCRWR